MLQQVIDGVDIEADQVIALCLTCTAVELVCQMRNKNSSIKFTTLGLAHHTCTNRVGPPTLTIKNIKTKILGIYWKLQKWEK